MRHGSYLALYWVLAGHHQDWNKWAYRELKQLHVDGRMFPHRDHVHTLLYTKDSVEYRDSDPGTRGAGARPPVQGSRRDDGQRATARTSACPRPRARCASAGHPMPLLVDAPGVAKDEGGEERFLDLYFLESDPEEVWDQFHADVANDPAVDWVGPFIPTIVGTDTYTDELW